MPQLKHELPAYIAPIACPHCKGEAYLMRRTPQGGDGGELRTFECKSCFKQTEIVTTRDGA